ncbi:MAG TPA: DUF4249 family protein, partial [Puia sp.]
PFSCVCKAECEQLISNNQINVLSDELINGNEIIHTVFYSPIYWFGNHFVEVKQYSLNRDSYIFWQQYLEQTNRTGSILDPLPASLIGNIHNAADSNDIALGYFEASAVNTKKVIAVPLFLQQYLLESIAQEYIEQGNCSLIYPNSLADDTDPQNWANADTIKVH